MALLLLNFHGSGSRKINQSISGLNNSIFDFSLVSTHVALTHHCILQSVRFGITTASCPILGTVCRVDVYKLGEFFVCVCVTILNERGLFDI